MRLRLLPLALQLRDIKVGAAAEDTLHDRLVLTRDSLVLLPPMWRWKWFKHSAVSPPPSSHLFRVLRETWPALGFSFRYGLSAFMIWYILERRSLLSRSIVAFLSAMF
mmetsp:Transcript_28398/g.84756  ORF Transcript_28398/g.84756 Transcript_28398/m.84756 type:complete len:108 (-) Transcript_28398:339-662(-)